MCNQITPMAHSAMSAQMQSAAMQNATAAARQAAWSQEQVRLSRLPRRERPSRVPKVAGRRK